VGNLTLVNNHAPANVPGVAWAMLTQLLHVNDYYS